MPLLSFPKLWPMALGVFFLSFRASFLSISSSFHPLFPAHPISFTIIINNNNNNNISFLSISSLHHHLLIQLNLPLLTIYKASSLYIKCDLFIFFVQHHNSSSSSLSSHRGFKLCGRKLGIPIFATSIATKEEKDSSEM